METRGPQPANFLSNLFLFLFRPKGGLALLRCETYASRMESLWRAVAVNGVVVADILPEEVKTGRCPSSRPRSRFLALYSVFPYRASPPLIQLSASRQPSAAP